MRRVCPEVVSTGVYSGLAGLVRAEQRDYPDEFQRGLDWTHPDLVLPDIGHAGQP